MIETVWLILWGILWSVYFMLDGFDLGLGVLLPVITGTEEEKKTIYHAIGPFWDGNEVWLVAAGGITFAAFPGGYAVMFSALYGLLMLILFALILRGVSIEFRGLSAGAAGKTFWDVLLALSSFVTAFSLGVLFANLFRGIPITGEGVFQGSIFTLLNPYGLMGGILFLLFFLMHGSLWLAIKSQGVLQARAVASARRYWEILLLVGICFLILTVFRTEICVTYLNRPLLLLLPTLAIAALAGIRFFVAAGAFWKAWFSSNILIAGLVLSCVIGLHPNLIPSSLDPAFSITIYQAASSPGTLRIMLVVAAIFLPLIIAYQGWAYRLFREQITGDDISDDAY